MEITGKVTGVARRLNSRSGNPRWTVWIDGIPFGTALDSQVNYDISESWTGQQIKGRVSGSTLITAKVLDGDRA
jgi:hypothetical protein